MILPPWYILVPICVGICALIIGVTALIIATKNYRRKSGLLIRGSYVIASSIDCNDKYVDRIILENLKDRGVTIFAVYLKIGHNFYLEVDNFEDKPMVLKAYETFQKEFGPIQFYGFNSRRFDLNKLLNDSKVKKRLILSTSDGKYKIPKPIMTWTPVLDFFKNHMTAIVRPAVTIYKEKYIGSNIKYIVEVFGAGKNDEVILIPEIEFRFNRFLNFKITEECLENKETFEKFLQEQVESGNLKCEKFVVHDTEEWHRRKGESYTEKIEGTYYTWFQYHVMGRFLTLYKDRKLSRKNSESSRKKLVAKESNKENQS